MSQNNNYTKYSKNGSERKDHNGSNEEKKKDEFKEYSKYELYVNQQRDTGTRIFVNVRKRPDDAGDIIDSLPEGTIIEVKRMVDNKWASVLFTDASGNKKSGFMMRQFMREVK